MLRKRAPRERRKNENPKPQRFRKLEELPGKPLIVQRDNHEISRKNIDKDALKVLYRLRNHGHYAFLVGGGVRDLLLGKAPKDFDIGTDASPSRIRALFRNSRIIGRRFKINHIYFYGNKIIEVATFRAPEEDSEGVVQNDNSYGTPETDAMRRDLTINGLFYDLNSFSIIDYVGGMKDLEDGVVRIIGDPEKRYKSDPVRMLRALRHAARISFEIEPSAYQAIIDNVSLIEDISRARIFEEMLKDFRSSYSFSVFWYWEKTGLLDVLMPLLSKSLASDRKRYKPFLEETLKGIDSNFSEGNKLSIASIFLALQIGKFDQGSLDDDTRKLFKEPLDDYWQVSPQLEKDCDFVPIKKLEKFNTELFKSIGVSRKEREDMERLLITRYDMLRFFMKGENPLPITKRHCFKDAFRLLGLTAHDSLAKECHEYWADIYAGL